MALVTCPDCNSQISDAAPACPKCGRPAAAAHTSPARGQQPETVLFEDKSVKVTDVRTVILSKTTYAMANITSVNEFVEPRPAGLALAGACFMIVGFLILQAGADAVGWIAMGFGGILTLIYYATKPKHWVRIGTAGAEANAIWSHDPAWTRKVVDAMNGAIIRRG